MKKKNINRVMMIIVSLLLALVLLSTSFVSSIYARYVVRDARKFEIGMTKFGVELIMTYKEDWGDEDDPNRKDVTITPTEKGDSISVTISDLMMFPGDDFPEIVRFKFVEGKTPNVPVKVTITQALSYSQENFIIESEEGTDPNVGNLKDDQWVMPLGFKFAAYNNSGTEVIPMGYVVNPWRLGAPSNDEQMNEADEQMNEALAGNLDAKFGDGVDYTDGQTKVTASFNPDDFGDGKLTGIKFKANGNSTADINQLVFGVEWPETWTSTEYNSFLREGATALDYNAMETWLCSRGRNLAVSITYTVKIEQA